MLVLKRTNQFKKDQKKLLKSNYKSTINILNNIIYKLLNNEQLEEKYKNHELIGKFTKCNDCHILPDLVLIYRIDDNILTLIRLGNHSELF